MPRWNLRCLCSRFRVLELIHQSHASILWLIWAAGHHVATVPFKDSSMTWTDGQTILWYFRIEWNYRSFKTVFAWCLPCDVWTAWDRLSILGWKFHLSLFPEATLPPALEGEEALRQCLLWTEIWYPLNSLISQEISIDIIDIPLAALSITTL